MFKHLQIGAALGLVVMGLDASQASAQSSIFRMNQGQGAISPGIRGSANVIASTYGASYGSPGMSGARMMSTGYNLPNDYSPYGYYMMMDPYGGYLRGTADAITAQGKYLIQTQQAYLLKDRVAREQLENRRRVFDQWLYERANTPTLQDQIDRMEREEARRGRNDPPVTEIWSAKSLNDLLANIIKTQMGSAQGPRILLDEEVLRQINVTAGRSGASLGILKNRAELSWPIALRDLPAGPVREQIQALIKKAYQDAKDGRAPDPGTIKELAANIDRLQTTLAGRVGDLPFSQYCEAKRYLGQLADVGKTLELPDAASYVNGAYSLAGLKSNTVADLVKHMADKGLRFAPAAAGEEGAYIALQRALAAYDTASER